MVINNIVSDSNKKRGAHYKAKKEYLLSGKLYCGYCGEPITVDSGSGRHGETFNYYKCSTRKNKRLPCDLVSVRKDKLEELVVSKIKTTILDTTNSLDKIADYICKAYNSTVVEDDAIKINEKALTKTQKEIDNIVNAIASGIFNESLKQRLTELEEEKNRLETENIKLKLKTKTKLTPEDAVNFLQSMIDVDNNTQSYKKRILQRFVNKVVLFNDRMDIYLIVANDLVDIDANIYERNVIETEMNNIKLLSGKGCLVLQCLLK